MLGAARQNARFAGAARPPVAPPSEARTVRNRFINSCASSGCDESSESQRECVSEEQRGKRELWRFESISAVCVCVCVLSDWVRAAICERPDLPALKCSFHWYLGLCLTSVGRAAWLCPVLMDDK
jgi:hypothetical protein